MGEAARGKELLSESEALAQTSGPASTNLPTLKFQGTGADARLTLTQREWKRTVRRGPGTESARPSGGKSQIASALSKTCLVRLDYFSSKLN